MNGTDAGGTSPPTGAWTALLLAGAGTGVVATAHPVRHGGALAALLLLALLAFVAGAVLSRLCARPEPAVSAALLVLGLAAACPGGAWASLAGGVCCAGAAGVVTACLAGPTGPRAERAAGALLLCVGVALGCAAASVRPSEAGAATSALACCCGLLRLARGPLPR